MATKRKKTGNGPAANLGFEQKLWLAADKLRGTMDAGEYKHTVLGLIFFQYRSDSLSRKRRTVPLLRGIKNNCARRCSMTDARKLWPDALLRIRAERL